MPTVKTEYTDRAEQYKTLIEKTLEETLSSTEFKVGEAMRYSLMSPGKRIRGILTLEFCRVCGGDISMAAYVAAAIEMVHAFSLVHDDLPCMDDDGFRRGQPSCHKKFGEATALLAGDGLLALAFNCAAVTAFLPKGLKPERVVKIISILSSSTGEMINGQQLDAEYETAKKVTEENLMNMYNRKTAALISSACVCGAVAAGAGEKSLHAARTYGQALGVAFQITDDLLDYKTEKKGKKTLPFLIGEVKAREKAEEITGLVIETAEQIRGGEFLKHLALSLIDRRN